MYDTRVYKDRRKARCENDPEYRVREQQRQRDRYLRKKFGATQETVDRAEEDEEPAEVSDILAMESSSSNNSQPEPPAPPPPPKVAPRRQQTPVAPPPAPPAAVLTCTPVLTNDLQTVSIRLPQSMAVLVVPVNLTSVSDGHDAMQLQQIGKKVAIVRGPMTNVAEFQVLPALNFEARAGIVGMDTDIRQIVTPEASEQGPTIQITPQMIREEVPVIIPESPPKPKIHPYIEAIYCGRCMESFPDLDSLSTHQRDTHGMMTIIRGAPLPDYEAQSTEKVATPLIVDTVSGNQKRRAVANTPDTDDNLDDFSLVLSPSESPSPTPIVKAKRTAAGRGRAQSGTPFSATSQRKVAKQDKGSTQSFQSFFQRAADEEEEEVDSGSELPPSLTHLVEQVMKEEDDEVEQLVQGSGQGGVKYSITSTGDGKGLLENNEHIITDAATGNQIVVHAETQEQLQQLLAGLEGGTIQMVNGSNSNEMMLVQHQLAEDLEQGEGTTPTGVDDQIIESVYEEISVPVTTRRGRK